MCGGDLAEVFRRSCNIPFAQTALELGADAMSTASAAGASTRRSRSTCPAPRRARSATPTDLDQNLPLLAIRGFGQNEDQMVPLHMAMVAGAVANDGQMMKPYVVEPTFDHDGRDLDRTSPTVWKTPISPQTAAIITDLMIGVAESGTASCCIALDGGIPSPPRPAPPNSALGETRPVHAWIVAFAPPTTRSTRCRSC